MLWQRWLNAKIIYWVIAGVAALAGGLILQVSAFLGAVNDGTVQRHVQQQVQKNREGMDHLRAWRLK